MSEVWAWRPLGDLFEIGAGKTMSAAARNGTGKTPFLRTSNVLWDELDLRSVDEMSIPEHELPGKLLRQGDLLVCEGGEIGRAAIWDGSVEVMSFQNHLHRLRPIVSDVKPRFYVFFLQSAFTQLGIFEGAGNKTTIPNLSRSRLAELRVPHPSLEEQQAITAALGRVRDALRVQNQALAASQALKRAAMNTLFTRGLRGEAQKETEIGPIPENWALKPIGDVFHITQGLSLKRNLARDSSGVPFLRTSNVRWGRLETANVSYMSLRDSPPTDKVLRPGDLLVCEGGEIGRAAVWDDSIAGCLFQNHLHCLRPLAASQTDPRFVVGWLEEGFRYRDVYEGAANRTTIPNLSRSRLAGLYIPQPTLEEQWEVATVLDTIDRKIGLNRRKGAALEQLFKTLLNKLMTQEAPISELGDQRDT